MDNTKKLLATRIYINTIDLYRNDNKNTHPAVYILLWRYMEVYEGTCT